MIRSRINLYFCSPLENDAYFEYQQWKHFEYWNFAAVSSVIRKQVLKKHAGFDDFLEIYAYLWNKLRN